MKFLIVGDLHLIDKELRMTKKGLENNKVMLDSIYQEIKDDEEIQGVIFLGDIQHQTPKDLKETYEWRKWFRKLRNEMESRNEQGSGVVVIEEGMKLTPLEETPCVFSLRGNHDSEIRNKRSDDFTFFDELVEDRLLLNPKGILLKGDKTYIDFRDYGKAEKMSTEEFKGKLRIVTLTHDNIYHDRSSDLVKMIAEKTGGHNIKDIAEGVDILINGHIHEKEAMNRIDVKGKEVKFYNLGSMGRTSLIPSMMRDIGHCAKLTVGRDLTLEEIELEVIPYKEYFNMREYLRTKSLREDLSNFSLGEVSFESEELNLEDKIVKIGEIYGEDVVNKTLEILQEVDSEIDYGEEE